LPRRPDPLDVTNSQSPAPPRPHRRNVRTRATRDIGVGSEQYILLDPTLDWGCSMATRVPPEVVAGVRFELSGVSHLQIESVRTNSQWYVIYV
jgi:hypothetical protein